MDSDTLKSSTPTTDTLVDLRSMKKDMRSRCNSQMHDMNENGDLAIDIFLI